MSTLTITKTILVMTETKAKYLFAPIPSRKEKYVTLRRNQMKLENKPIRR